MADNTSSKNTSEAPTGMNNESSAKPGNPPLPPTIDRKDPAPFDFRSTINVSEVTPEDYARKDSIDMPTTKGKQGHMRGVSWDAQVTDNEKNPKLHAKPDLIVQPQLSDASSSPKPVLKPSTLPPRPPTMNMAKKASRPNLMSGASRSNLMVGTSTRKIDFGPVNMGTLESEAEDLLLELEAESNLIRQLDDDGARIDPASNLLVGVDDTELKHDFSLDGKPPASPGSPASPRSPNSPARPRATSRDVHTPRQEIKKVAHRRQLTVEETLFGLTAALSAVHHEEQKQRSEYVPDEQMISGHRRSETGASKDPMEKAVNLFFRNKLGGDTSDEMTGTNQGPQAQTTQATAAATAATPGASKWAKMRESVLNKDEFAKRKKSDDYSNNALKNVEEVDADIENGVHPDFDEAHFKGTDEASDEDGQFDSSHKNNQESSKQMKKKKKKKKNPFSHLPYADKIKKDWDQFGEFLRPRKTSMFQYARIILFYIWIPALGVAAILYHLFDNPPTGKGEEADPSQASASWWIIFICIREVFIVCLAKIMQILVIDYFALNTQASLRFCGPLVTLLLVQSKGWPFMVLFWGLLNFSLVTGTYKFSSHWLYWQDLWGLFNANNPSGNVTESHQFYVLCAVAVGVGVSVSLKRLLVSVLLGRQTFANYSQQLAKLMAKMLQISEVSGLAKDIEKSYMYEARYGGKPRGDQKRNMSNENLQGLIAAADAEDLGEEVSVLDNNTLKSGGLGDEENERVIDTDDIDPYTGKLSYAQKARVRELLGQWEEPPRGPRSIGAISISSVLHFRRALAHMDTDYPFSAAFGVANTRENCVAAAQTVYERLLLKQDLTDEGYLQFDTIAILALQRDGELDKEKLKGYIRAFRPTRDGGITMIDFVKSVDAVYKELRMLKATVASSSKIDKALEKIFNIAFYVLLAAVILSQTGFDVLALFISLSSVVLAFAFMIGSASAKYFEGLLFILVQRPYGIGDRINVSNPESEANMGGSQGWIVENVTLFTTTVFLAGTSERATISNGSLAKSRIINGARSPKPVCYVVMRFGIETPYKKVEIFKNAVDKFVRNRPREWLGMTGFRCARIEADQGFIEYSIILQHRESWQNIVPVLNSKHLVHCFCLELAKKLDMRYKSPSLPVDLNLVGGAKPPSQFELKYPQEKMGEDYAEVQPGTPKRRQSSDMAQTTSPRSIGDNSAELDEIAAMFEGK